MRRAAIVMLLSSVAVIQPPSVVAWYGDLEQQAVLDRIFADWEKRRASMDAVEYRLNGTELVPKGIKSITAAGLLPAGATGPIPPEDRNFDIELRYVFDFSGNRIRIERRGHKFGADEAEFHPYFEIELFDGEKVQSLLPRAENTTPEFTIPEYQPELVYQTTQHLNFLLDFEQEVIYLAHGRPPVFKSPGSAFERFTLPIQREIFRWHSDAKLDGRDCVVLRTTNAKDSGEAFFEYWVELARESAVLRCLRNMNGNVDQLDIEYEENEHRWLPSGYVRTTTWSDGTLYTHHTMAVTGLVPNPRLTDDLFHSDPKPGMVVRDSASDKAYVYSGAGKPDVDVREHYLQNLRESQQGGRARWIAIALIATVATTTVAVAVLRRRRSG
jgi:hypothetical protein